MKTIIKRFETGMHYLSIPNAKALEFLNKKQKRVIIIVNKSIELHAAIMSSKDKGNFIYIGSKVLKKGKLKEKDEVSIEIKPDLSELKFDVPAEFEEVFNTDIKAKQIFDSLTPGNKRSLIYLVTLVKSTDKRIERSLKIAEQLKIGITSARNIKF